MSDRHAVFLDYYDRERVQRGLVFFRHRAAALARRRRRHLDTAAGLLALVGLGSVAAFALPLAESGSPALWLAVIGPVLVMAVVAVATMHGCDARLERCQLAYADLERIRAERSPHATTGANLSPADVEAYVELVEAFLAAVPYPQRREEEGRR